MHTEYTIRVSMCVFGCAVIPICMRLHFLLQHDKSLPSTNTPRCEAGDLAGKFGRLDSTGRIDVVDTTGQLVLDGRYSIIGRSVVIHAVDGSNFECGTIRSEEDNMCEWYYR